MKLVKGLTALAITAASIIGLAGQANAGGYENLGGGRRLENVPSRRAQVQPGRVCRRLQRVYHPGYFTVRNLTNGTVSYKVGEVWFRLGAGRVRNHSVGGGSTSCNYKPYKTTVFYDKFYQGGLQLQSYTLKAGNVYNFKAGKRGVKLLTGGNQSRVRVYPQNQTRFENPYYQY